MNFKHLAAFSLAFLLAIIPGSAMALTDVAGDMMGDNSITDNMAYADGTSIAGQTVGGTTWNCVGIPQTLQGRLLTNPGGNSYCGFANIPVGAVSAQPVKHFGETAAFLKSNGCAWTIIAEHVAAGPINTMYHLNLCPDQWALMVMVGGVWQPSVHSGFYASSTIIPLGSPRHAAMDIDEAHTNIVLHLPDGEVLSITDAAFTGIAPDGVRFQEGGFAGANALQVGNVWVNQNRASFFRAWGDGATEAELVPLRAFVGGGVPPTAKTLADNVWTTIAQVDVSSGAGVTDFEIQGLADLGSYAPGFADSWGTWDVIVTGSGGGSVMSVTAAPGTPHLDIWSPGSAGVQLNIQAVHTSGTTILIQAKAVQYNAGTGTHPIVWEAHRRGDTAATITPQ